MQVQLSLERFLPELRDLERKNIFSKVTIPLSFALSQEGS